MFNLSGKKALVTGGSRGIGKGIVLALAEQGADICINYHSKAEEAMGVVRQAVQMGREAWSFQADVSSQDNVVVMFEEISKKWGRLDILVNNAGILKFAPFAEITEADWDQVLAVNLKGQFLCAKQAVRLMKPGSKIINLASIASGGVGVGFPSIAHYTASKGGVVAMTETMAIELGVKGINVNAIAPGMIESDMTKTMLADQKTKAGMIARVAKKRPGTPKDIGAAAAFLASDEADYITGTVLYVDGGWLAG
jgi:NAD(P)-dependent dehydrogenase (short-subunit alcohol dehydrogenase family)